MNASEWAAMYPVAELLWPDGKRDEEKFAAQMASWFPHLEHLPAEAVFTGFNTLATRADRFPTLRQLLEVSNDEAASIRTRNQARAMLPAPKKLSPEQVEAELDRGDREYEAVRKHELQDYARHYGLSAEETTKALQEIEQPGPVASAARTRLMALFTSGEAPTFRELLREDLPSERRGKPERVEFSVPPASVEEEARQWVDAVQSGERTVDELRALPDGELKEACREEFRRRREENHVPAA